MTEDKPHLIEVAFPLKQTSLLSLNEKYGPKGHISGFHLWPARRPLAACRAVLIATLLTDPGNDAERRRLMETLGGSVKTKNTFKNIGGLKVPVLKEYTEGGILHWGQENGLELDLFRQELIKACDGKAPRVLDPFAGGGAIPFEAMRLGCDVTAIDINPVAWFILKCTLEYPQRFAGRKRPLPQFALESSEFMEEYWKAAGHGKKGRRAGEPSIQPSMLEAPEVDLAWHVRAWGHWVLVQARKDLDRFYPTIDGKPTVAYLWARTVTCKNCRATIPLLKTLWLCRKDKKRIRLKMNPNSDRSGVDFEVVEEPVIGGNAAQRRAHDQQIGRGTMSRSGVWCPVCGTFGTVAMTRNDIRADVIMQHTQNSPCVQMTAVVVDGANGKEYRKPEPEEINVVKEAASHIEDVFKKVPFGLPQEKIHIDAKGSTWCIQYGLDTFNKLFTARQLMALGTFVNYIRLVRAQMRKEVYDSEWIEAVSVYLASAFDRLIDQSTSLATWYLPGENVKHTFVRFALPMTWDFAETNTVQSGGGSWSSAVNLCSEALRRCLLSLSIAHRPEVIKTSAICVQSREKYDVVITDPPYYDAIPYSNTMDLFYVWLRRTLYGLSPRIDESIEEPLTPKWNHKENDGELVDDATRFGNDHQRSKAAYEDGMFRSFHAAKNSLVDNGHMVIVFANKQPDAWETLVSAVIRAGFIVTGSWPIQTEQPSRLRSFESAALSSSVWLVCRKRPEMARPGWDNQVLDDMRIRINEKLRGFWDAGIRGPDFVWAATGPALEAYSKHPVVKKADQPNALMEVPEFLRHVRRIVVDYVVGKVLSRNGNGQTAEGLDDLTLYYLLHRHDFGLEEAPVGACILYAQSCNLADRDLVDRYDLLSYGKKQAVAEVEEDETDENDEAEEQSATSGSTVRLKRWEQRQRKDLGINTGGRVAPLIDQVHRIMHLWRAGDVQKVDSYLEDQGLRRNPLFPRLLQALIELSGKNNQPEERSLLESIMNHITARGAHPQMRLLDDEEA